MKKKQDGNQVTGTSSCNEEQTWEEPKSKSSTPAARASKNQDGAVAVPEAQHAAWFQFLRAHSKVTQRVEARLLQSKQIPPHWYDVLVTLEKAPGQRLRMSELAENVLTSRSNLTRLVDRLEAEGLLCRVSCPNDRRGSYASLTEAGAKARLAAWPVVSRGIVELFAAHVSDEEARVLMEVLQRVADGVPVSG